MELLTENSINIVIWNPESNYYIAVEKTAELAAMLLNQYGSGYRTFKTPLRRQPKTSPAPHIRRGAVEEL